MNQPHFVLLAMLAIPLPAAVVGGYVVGGYQEDPAPLERTTEEDHVGMMRRLGITALRPGPSGQADAPNPGNYDESIANPFPEWPDLVTMAFDERFAAVLIGSSGEGGASPYRRNFGEMVENLTGRSEYHWMAGNFLKYGTAESSFGSMNAGDLPVDSHSLIALVAPRPAFISYGVPEEGDALWLDQQGSYMAGVAAAKVYDLLGAAAFGVGADYRTAKMPPVNTSLLDGTLAWRQHDGGHTDAPNWRYFIPWAERELRLD